MVELLLGQMESCHVAKDLGVEEVETMDRLVWLASGKLLSSGGEASFYPDSSVGLKFQSEDLMRMAVLHQLGFEWQLCEDYY